MSLYELLLFGHILAVIVWIGGGAFVQVLVTRAMLSDEPERMVFLSRDVAWAGTRIFMPASIVTLALGIGLVLEGPWAFRDLWVALGLAGIAATAVTGAAFMGPRTERLTALIDEEGASSASARSLARQILLVGRVDLVVLVLVVFDMVVKPGA